MGSEQVGVVGLGNIGGAVARNLLADGYAVTVYDAVPERVTALVAEGAQGATDVAAVGRASAFTFVSVPTPAVMEEVATAWLAAAAPAAVLIDLTTNAPATVRAVGERIAAAGRHLLEAPLTGGAPGAQARMLVFMVGGEAAAYARAKPLLDRLGRASFHLGGLGLGNTAKLVNSLLAFTATVASLEVLGVAVRAGIDLRAMIDVVRAGGAGNIFTDRMVEGINERGRPTMFALALAAKDAGLLVELAREQAVPVPIAAQVAQTLVAAVGAGLGERDFTDLVELVERQSGVRFSLAPPRT
ncbi:MAG: NAD(P)-dependent oxidoreductase [bacterium]|nr:NAD(P)-dependent oxidoreductase [bacterium]